MRLAASLALARLGKQAHHTKMVTKVILKPFGNTHGFPYQIDGIVIPRSERSLGAQEDFMLVSGVKVEI